jgi:hypothetical protein
MTDFEDIIDLVEVELCENTSPQMVRETLSRMGIADKKNKVLYPSCYLYEEDGIYFVAHFKELYALQENGFNNISDKDIERRNAIIFCLERWGMIKTICPEQIDSHEMFIFILPHKERYSWKIIHKFKEKASK